MSIFHLSVQIIGRSRGRSSTAAAAYRAAYRIFDSRTGEVHNFTRKSGVRECFILAPEFAPDWVGDRAALWNAVERIEKRKDAQLARELELALPHELPHDVRRVLLVEFIRDELVSRGMVADVAMHMPGKHGDRRNEHAHVLLTLRHISRDGFGCKAREWNDSGLVERWRESWARRVNEALANNAILSRVDHRSYRRQALASGDKMVAGNLPTMHLGPGASAMERRGIRTIPGELNRKVRILNLKLEQAIRQFESEAEVQVDQEVGSAISKYDRDVMRRRAHLQKALQEALRLPRVATAQEAHEAIRQQLACLSAAGNCSVEESEPLRNAIRQFAKMDITVCRLTGQLNALEAQSQKLRTQKDKNIRVQRWRHEHPYRAWLNDAGVLRLDAAEWAMDPVEWQSNWDEARTRNEQIKGWLESALAARSAASRNMAQIRGSEERRALQKVQEAAQSLDQARLWADELAGLEDRLHAEPESHASAREVALEDDEDDADLIFRP